MICDQQSTAKYSKVHKSRVDSIPSGGTKQRSNQHTATPVLYVRARPAKNSCCRLSSFALLHCRGRPSYRQVSSNVTSLSSPYLGVSSAPWAFYFRAIFHFVFLVLLLFIGGHLKSHTMICWSTVIQSSGSSLQIAGESWLQVSYTVSPTCGYTLPLQWVMFQHKTVPRGDGDRNRDWDDEDQAQTVEYDPLMEGVVVNEWMTVAHEVVPDVPSRYHHPKIYCPR